MSRSDLKPMLGTSVPRASLEEQFRVRKFLASFKLDGIRALVKDGVVLSRSLKPIPNQHVQKLFGKPELEGFDGELIVGDSNAKDVFRKTTSGVMSPDGEPDVYYHVFDLWNMQTTPFHDRVAKYTQRIRSKCTPVVMGGEPSRVLAVVQYKVETPADVNKMFDAALSTGFEGLIVRNTLGMYKYGRSTISEGGLLKMKPFVDAEAKVVGFVELQHNENEAFTNELGRTARSTAKAGKVAGGTLGALVCETPEGVQFEIGTGFDAAERLQIWNNQKVFMGRLAKYKSLVIGVKDKPRHAVFLGFRDRKDT